MRTADLLSTTTLDATNLNARLRKLQEEGGVELRQRRIRVLDSDGLRDSRGARGRPPQSCRLMMRKCVMVQAPEQASVPLQLVAVPDFFEELRGRLRSRGK